MAFYVSECQEVEETYQLDLDLIVKIKRVIVKNSTSEVDIHLLVRNFPEETSNVSFLLDSGISYYLMNCSGRTNFLQGTLEDQLWYLDGFGELFPFDFYTLDFRFYPYYCQYYFNGTVYGLDSWSYSFQNDTRIVFAGLQRSRLEEEWEIFCFKDEDGATAYLFRESEVESFQFIFPLVAIQLLLIFSPSFTRKRSIRTTIYSSILLFTPMFIFAMQNFIPPRSTLSIPEFFGINLIFA